MTSPGSERSSRLLVLVACALALVLAWATPLRQGFWVDEAGTAWCVKDSLAEAAARATRFQGQSPFSYAIAWAARAALGTSPLALRLPSIVAALLAIGLVHRLAARLIDREAALPAAAMLIPLVAPHATSARPYAIAIFFAVAATLALVAWLDRGGPARAALWAVLAAGLVATHFFFGVVLLVHLAYATDRVRARSTSVTSRGLVLAGAGLGVLLVPLLPQLLALAGRRQELVLSAPPTTGLAARALVPSVVLLGLLAGALVGKTLAKELRLTGRLPCAPEELRLLVLWHVVPPLALLGLSALGDAPVTLPRYWSSALPGTALLAALALRSLEPAKARAWAALVAVVLVATNPEPHPDDWREAASAVRAVRGERPARVLVSTPLVEGARREWITDAERRSYLLAALSLEGLDERELVLLPKDLEWDEGQLRWLEETIAPVASRDARLVLVTPSPRFVAWCDARLAPLGFAHRTTRHEGGQAIVLYER